MNNVEAETSGSRNETESGCGGVGLLSPLEGVYCFGNEREALTEYGKFFNNPLLSDVKLTVGNQTFLTHKMVLIKSSEVFERMFSPEWADDSKTEYELVEDPNCVSVFSSFLKYLYTCSVNLNCDNALQLLVLADKYNVVDLRNVCIHFVVVHLMPKLQLKVVFHVWFQYATKCYHTSLVNSCVAVLSDRMDDIVSSDEWEDEWVSLDETQLIELLQSSDLVVKDEYTLFNGVLKWLESTNHPERLKNTETHLNSLLPQIRFPMMMPDQLNEAEKSKQVMQYKTLFNPYLLLAYKFHALPLLSRTSVKEFTGTAFLLRNYTETRWDKRIVINNFSAIPKFSEVNPRFSTRSSYFPPSIWDWELKLHPKGLSSSSEEFRALLCANVIIDQSRPVEYMLSIVDNERIIRSVTGKKNFLKSRYTTDTEIDKKVTVQELTEPSSGLLILDKLVLQITLKPVE